MMTRLTMKAGILALVLRRSEPCHRQIDRYFSAEKRPLTAGGRASLGRERAKVEDQRAPRSFGSRMPALQVADSSKDIRPTFLHVRGSAERIAAGRVGG